jgi:glutaconate CoA-transferase subunit B
MGYDRDGGTLHMTLEALNPGVTMEQVVDSTGFELIIRGEVPNLDPPTEQELRTLREEIDPQGLYI